MSAITARARAPSGERSSAHPAAIALVAALVAVASQSLWIPVDADVSWLITVSERVLSGDRLYVDIVEVNPPASVWLYLPLVWLAKLLSIRPEAVVVVAFAIAGVASVLATVKLAARLRDAPRPELLAAATAFVALLLPMALFAQREHAALLLALPALTTLAVLAERRRLSRRVLIAAGAAAGLIIVIKPYFLLAVLLPALWALWARRSFRPFLPALLAGAAVLGAYAAAVLLFAPAYLPLVPVIASTYAPMHDALWKVLLGPAFFPAITIALAALLRPGRVPTLAWSWALGAAGFLVAALVQAKNYPNHWLPQAALALTAAAAILPLPQIQNSRRACIGAALALVGLFEMYHWAILPDPRVEQAVREVAPPSPKMLALSPQLTTGHPVTRNVDGQWVGSSAGLFTASGARYVGLKTAEVRAAYRWDLGVFAADVARHSPDVILVGTTSKSWLMAEPEIASAMAAYRPVKQAGEVEVWVRRSAAR